MQYSMRESKSAYDLVKNELGSFLGRELLVADSAAGNDGVIYQFSNASEDGAVF